LKRLTRSFYARDALSVARDLIGCVLVHRGPDAVTSVRLVETEAYRGVLDPGSHGYRGMTPRTEVMYGPPGHLYVYFTYGMHWCANVVCATEGACEAALLRAGEPLEGIDAMRERRGAVPDKLLAAGPARLAQAMGFDKTQNGAALVGGKASIYLFEDAQTSSYRSNEIAQTVRIGLSPGKGDDLPWRFVVKGSPYASRRY
jgi:DNA-3-methyladenine glycosylase